MVIHNFIRRHDREDTIFQDFISKGLGYVDDEDSNEESSTTQMREAIQDVVRVKYVMTFVLLNNFIEQLKTITKLTIHSFARYTWVKFIIMAMHILWGT